MTNSRNVYAKYAVGEFTTHTVTFLDYDGRLAGNRQYVQDGGSAGSPVMPERPGYTFLGWDESRFYIKGDKTLNAQYREGVYKTYMLNYYGYRNNKATEQILKEEIVVEGEDGVPPEPEEVEGYTFAGWDRNILYTNVYRSQNIKALYYKGKYSTHKVEFVDYNGKALMNPQHIPDGESAYSPLKPVREGYTFIGWDKSRFWIHKDTKLTARYREGEHKTYTQNYYGYRNNKATEQILKEEIVVEGEDGVPPEPEEIEGYTFAGWDRNVLYTNVYRNQNIKALYYKGKYRTHKVEFVDYNGKALMNPQHIPDGESAYSPLKPVREGHTFIGWDKSRFWIHKDTKLTARYREGEHKTYTQNYYGYRNNKTTEQILKEEIVVEGEDGVPPEPEEVEGYTFAGWDRNILYTNVYRNQNVKALYYKGKYRTHKVEFVDYNGKALLNPQYIVDGESAYSPLKPVREGHTFIGWDKSRFWIHKDTKLTARYLEGEHKTYTLNYYGYRNNKATEQILKEEIVVEGEDGVPPEPEEIEGYTFAGWDRNILYTSVYRSQNIKATYYKGKYRTHKVEFVDYNGKALLNPQYIVDGESAYSPLKPVREGHTFIGWDKSRFWIHKDTKLTARYLEGEHKTYTLNYYGYRNNKATEQILKEEIVVEGEDGVPPEPEEIEGYTFAGWDRNILYTSVYRSQNIKALYYKGKYRTHKVEFVDYNGKALLNPQYVVDGGSAVSPLKPVREGYTFIGWDKENYRISSPLKIQALYKEGIYLTCPVSFYGKITGNSSWQLLKTEYVPVGDDAHPPKLPVNAGYTFREWSGQITGIQTAQNVYAQYNINTETETTYTVRFWCRGEVIKTEEVAIGGNATPPSVPGLKGYSFAGWDKSYVNINPGTRSMAVDITAQYQLTSGIQNAGSVSDLVNALMALGVPVAVKNGFSALGAAIINPFDGIILDVLAATALVGTIIYYWDDIKDLWEDIKVIFRNFAGMDAAGEILDNIEAGVDEAGGSEDITAQLGEIAKGYPVGKCDDAVKAMQEFLIQKKLKGSIIILRWIPSNGYVWSDIANREVGNNGMHQGILYKGKVYCNIHPYGLLKDLWINDFYAPGVKQPVEEIPF
ncbi:InlB B-repeat-containing protein [uncultured Robinsoniella sp.]|uniref:InlB B-repeat-containing protein n=1 Tax=uncultured Robinsoniella sp. TaxID=904190 RepID=UPI00374EC3CB